jgi:adenylate cyclase
MALIHRIVSGASLERLERLIEKRLAAGADKAAVDKHIWDLFGERWAVMYTDLTGFSRHVASYGVIDFLQHVYELHNILMPHIEEHGGILLKLEGDSMLVIFRKADEAIHCAVDFQRAIKAHNEKHQRGAADTLLLCIGIGYGDVLRIGDSDVFGAEVNAACKLGEDQAKSWEIMVTGAARSAAAEVPGTGYEALAQCPPGADSAFKVTYSL